MVIDPTKYKNADIRQLAEDLNAALSGGGNGATEESLLQLIANLNGEDNVTPGSNLDGIINNTAQTKDRLQDGDGTPLGTLVRQLVDYTDTLISLTRPVLNSRLGTHLIIADTPDPNDLQDQYNSWIAGNSALAILHVTYMRNASNESLLITFISE